MPSANHLSPLLPLIPGVIYGPITSRRLGLSLGVNLLPTQEKVCSFNCVYCQYGWTAARMPPPQQWPSADEVGIALSRALAQLGRGRRLHRITLAGHGEPTLHPDFERVVNAVRETRDRLAPSAAVAALTNGTRAHIASVRAGLQRLDECYIKLDGGDQDTLRRVNATSFSIAQLTESITALPSAIVQSLFVEDPLGRCGNASAAAMNAWLNTVLRIRPRVVHLYTVARTPALSRLRRVPQQTLLTLATRLREKGIDAQVFD